jgi:alginate O-acetyltransferase complex protein AlgI
LVFSSNVFLFAYLPIVLALYYILPKKLRNPVLLITSLIFYGWGEPIYLLLMITTILLDYICGLLIHRFAEQAGARKAVLIVGVALNLLSLGFFKYAGFFAEQFNAIGFLPDIPVPEVTLPIGISFYVFQSMSYIIDVYRNDAPVQKDPVGFGTYVTLFPQLIAGPIVRYADVAQQLQHRRENLPDFASGVMLFMVGLSKKMLLANPMGNLCTEMMADSGTLSAWVGAIAFTLQLYFDFSGYSDMARGLGRMLGFEFLPNFDYPYISRSVTEFWRRWHISLSTWFKEYVYIPLGGNRKGMARQILNISIVWALTGFWHGASWNFLLWGLYYAVLLIFEKTFWLKLLQKLPRFVGHIYTVFVFVMGWVLFYFTDFGQLGAFLVRLFAGVPTQRFTGNLILGFLPLTAVAIFASTPAMKRLQEKYAEKPLVRYGCIAAAAAAMILCVAALASQSYNPFIYFRF